MGPKEMLMIGAAVLLLVGVTLAVNWAKSRSGNSANKNQS